MCLSVCRAGVRRGCAGAGGRGRGDGTPFAARPAPPAACRMLQVAEFELKLPEFMEFCCQGFYLRQKAFQMFCRRGDKIVHEKVARNIARYSYNTTIILVWIVSIYSVHKFTELQNQNVMFYDLQVDPSVAFVYPVSLVPIFFHNLSRAYQSHQPTNILFYNFKHIIDNH